MIFKFDVAIAFYKFAAKFFRKPFFKFNAGKANLSSEFIAKFKSKF
ncbi:hypothetical protein CAMSH0001_1124 [Campylobacter showae RM3277]|uniref:Uncharacterized protein n=1 Tax=Campylobacter showae RM3277 TaxID=553219 RepID=C6RI13_9BACT|nr:hypothetical protein CAMSH0001_1124 [Campylobacter showae RM3277]